MKPTNFVVDERDDGTGRRRMLKIIDFGLSKMWAKEDASGIPVGTRGGNILAREESNTAGGFRGTTMYASRKAMEGRDVGRADDLISVVYTFVDLINGGLNWRYHAKGKAKDPKKVKEMKDFENKSNNWCACETLGKNTKFKNNVKKIVRYLEGLEFQEDVGYEKCIGMMEQAAESADEKGKNRGAVEISWGAGFPIDPTPMVVNLCEMVKNQTKADYKMETWILASEFVFEKYTGKLGEMELKRGYSEGLVQCLEYLIEVGGADRVKRTVLELVLEREKRKLPPDM